MKYVNMIERKTLEIEFSPEASKRIVYVCGSFDLIHPSHIEVLNTARSIGDELIVSLNTDDFIEKYKGKSPVLSYEKRAFILGNLKSVDKVIPHEAEDDIRAITEYGANICVYGRQKRERKNGSMLDNIHEKHGVRVYQVYPSDTEISTTELKTRSISKNVRG